jgi:pimeloyl-ACP methyl ester carboxylesterase
MFDGAKVNRAHYISEAHMPEVMIENNCCYYAISRRAPERGPAAVCVHGSGSDGIVWSYQLSRLSSSYRIIVPDLPGHGRSDGLPLDSAAAYAAWLEQFCCALALDTFFLLGHSLGGAVVQEYARSNLHRVRGMVLVGTGTRFMLSRIYRELCESGEPPGDGAAAGGMPAGPFHEGYELLRSQCSGALHADLMAAARFDSSEWVGSLVAPAMVVWGSRDAITPRELPEELAGKLPRGRLQIIDGAGHVVMVDARNEFNRLVAEFIEQHRAAAST